MAVTVSLVKKLILKYIGGSPLMQARMMKVEYQKVARVRSSLLGSLTDIVNQVMGTIAQIRGYVAMAQSIINNPLGAVAGLVSTEFSRWAGGALGGLSSVIGGAGPLNEVYKAVNQAVGAFNGVQKFAADIMYEIDSVLSTVNNIRYEFNSIVSQIDSNIRSFGGLIGDVTGELVTMPTLSDLLSMDARYRDLTGTSYPGIENIIAPMMTATQGTALLTSLTTAEARLTANTITYQQFIDELDAHREYFYTIQCDAIALYNGLIEDLEELENEYSEEIAPVLTAYNALLENEDSPIVGALISNGLYNDTLLKSFLPTITESETNAF